MPGTTRWVSRSRESTVSTICRPTGDVVVTVLAAALKVLVNTFSGVHAAPELRRGSVSDIQHERSSHHHPASPGYQVSNTDCVERSFASRIRIDRCAHNEKDRTNENTDQERYLKPVLVCSDVSHRANNQFRERGDARQCREGRQHDRSAAIWNRPDVSTTK